jgi:hypothetical protein
LNSLAKWKGLQSLTAGDRKAITHNLGPDETRAAKRLDVSVLDVAAAAFELYGHSIIEEREKRVVAHFRGEPDPTPRTVQALRGHVMRQLDQEIHAAVRAAEDRAVERKANDGSDS